MTSPIITVEGLNAFYGTKQALKNVNLEVHEKGVTAFIGPSGCGKSTLLRCLNRMNDRITGFKAVGKVNVHGVDPYHKKTDLLELRRKVGMVFQKPTPFPKTIFENVALGPKCHYGIHGEQLEESCKKALEDAALWREVKDDWKKKSGMSLSGGQQQRLCIARALAIEPEIILMDEPCSALDPISTERIEELIVELAKERTVVIVTHNLQQAERISNFTAFFMLGEIVEALPSRELFSTPTKQETKDYVTGRFG